MKRFFFSLIALSAAAIGCTQSALLETPEQFGTEITFSPYTGRTPVTKATSIDDDSGLRAAGGFYVYSFLNEDTTTPYMDNVLVQGSTSTVNIDGTPTKVTTWTPGKTVYWPESGSSSTLDFVAYSANAWGTNNTPDASNATTKDDNIVWSAEEGKEYAFTFTVPGTIDTQVDLVATALQKGLSLADKTGMVNSTTGQVTLKFYHLLSRVGFKVQTTTSQAVKITSIRLLGRMPNKGELDLMSAKGTETPVLNAISTSKDDYSYTFAESSTGIEITGAKEEAKFVYQTPKYLMIMPHTAMPAADGLGSDHSIVVSYMVGGSNQVNNVSARLPIGFEFEAGKAYEFVLKLSTSKLSFEVKEEPWDSDLNNNLKEDDDTTMGPLEPDDEDEDTGGSNDDTEGDQSLPNTLTISAGLTLGIVSLESDALVTTITVSTSAFDDIEDWGTDTDYEIGILYKPITSSDWTRKPLIQESSNGYSSSFTITNLSSGVPYECKLYSGKRTRRSILSSWTSWAYSDYDATLSFATPSKIDNFTVLSDAPTLVRYTASDGTTTQTRATFSHYPVTLKVDGQSKNISEYGFCWMSGAGTPSKLYSYVNNTTSPKVSGDLASGFSYIVEGLKQNSTYTYCAYVVIKDEVRAYVIPDGEISAVETVIYSAGTTIFSAPLSFRTEAIVNGNDNTGGSWGAGGDTNI